MGAMHGGYSDPYGHDDEDEQIEGVSRPLPASSLAQRAAAAIVGGGAGGAGARPLPNGSAISTASAAAPASSPAVEAAPSVRSLVAPEPQPK